MGGIVWLVLLAVFWRYALMAAILIPAILAMLYVMGGVTKAAFTPPREDD